MHRLDSTMCANADFGLPESGLGPFDGLAFITFPGLEAPLSRFSSALNGCGSTLELTCSPFSLTGGRKHASLLPRFSCDAGNEPTRTSPSNSRSTGAPPLSCISE